VIPGKGGAKGYALLREAIRTSSTVGIGKLTLRQKEHLVALKVVGDAIVLETMRFANELLPADELEFPSADDVRPQELTMAQQLVANLAEPFDATKYTDDYRERLQRIIKAKLKGKKIEADEPEMAESTPVIDLMARLEASLAQSDRSSRKGSRAGRRETRATGGTRPRKKKTA
jgi:DNA end-binding protein Ku